MQEAGGAGQPPLHASTCAPSDSPGGCLTGLSDAQLDALEDLFDDVDFPDESIRLQAEYARRRLEDRAWVEEVTAAGFTGRVFEEVWAGLAAYAIWTLMKWMGSGRIAVKCRAVGRPISLEAQGSYRWTEEDRMEIAIETVAKALDVFKRQALIGGGWNYRRGAGLRTYLVGACILQFPNVYDRWLREHRNWHTRHLTVDDDTRAEDTLLPAHIGWHDPTAETITARHTGMDLLADIPDELTRRAVQLVSDGLTYPEAATRLGLTARAIEGRIYRLKATMTGKWDMP